VGGREEAASSQVARVGLRRYGHSGREVINGRIAADAGSAACARQEVEAGMAPMFNALSATACSPPREATLFGQDAAGALTMIQRFGIKARGWGLPSTFKHAGSGCSPCR
jgi:hypothetical protein